jgi:hypothetical protein
MEAKSERQSASSDEDPAEVTESVVDQSASGLSGPGLPTHVYLGSPCSSASTISEIEGIHREDHVFANFRRKFTEFVNHCLPSYGIQLNGWTRFEPTFKVLTFPRKNLNTDSNASSY